MMNKIFGIIYKVTNLIEGCMSNVACGRAKTHNGWKCIKNG